MRSGQTIAAAAPLFRNALAGLDKGRTSRQIRVWRSEGGKEMTAYLVCFAWIQNPSSSNRRSGQGPRSTAEAEFTSARTPKLLGSRATPSGSTIQVFHS